MFCHRDGEAPMSVLGKLGGGLALTAALALSITGSSAAVAPGGELVVDGKVVLQSPARGVCHQATVREGSTVANYTSALAYFYPDAECRLSEPCMVAPSKGGTAHATGLSVKFIEETTAPK